MPLEILTLRTVGDSNLGAVTMKLTGSLDTSTAPDLYRQLSSLLAEQIHHVIFDLAQLKFISSAGQALFVNMQPQVQEVLEIIRSLPGMATFKDMAELDRFLAARQQAHEKKP